MGSPVRAIVMSGFFSEMSLVQQIAVTPQVFGHQLKGEMQSLRASECIQWGRCEHPQRREAALLQGFAGW